MAAKKLTPAEKAAVVLLSLGEEAAAPILKALPRPEMTRVLRALASLGHVDKETIDEALREMSQTLKTSDQGLAGSTQAAKKLLAKALPGEPKATWDDMFGGGSPALIDILREIDLSLLASFFAKEEPPQIAVALAHMDSARGAACLKLLPESLQTTVLERLATLAPVHPQALEDLTDVLQNLAQSATKALRQSLGGTAKVAALINGLDPSLGQSLMQGLGERDPSLAEHVQSLLFQFADLARLPDKSLVEVMKSVPSDTLKLALKSAPEAVAHALYRNMSGRARDMLQDDIAAMGLVKKSDVEKAQKTIAATARRLIDEGKIMGPGDSSEYV